MPSIPQSLLWISLVVLWLFVLVPMLVSKRDAVRRTSDVALATRVLNSGTAARLLRRGGPAAGHRSNPDWQPEEDAFDDLDDDVDESPTAEIVVAAPAAVVVEAEPELVEAEASEDDVVVDDESEPVVADATAEHDEDVDAQDDEYEYVADTSGIPVAEEPETRATAAISRRHGYDARKAAAISARKYAFRKRMLVAMALMLAASAAAAFVLTPTAWWVCGSTGAVTMLYLAYLRRQTRIEARVRRRRMQRMARSRLGVENTYDREFDVVPSRLRRPGAVVLEIDDEDPIFEHLDYAPYAREYGWHRDLPRAVGQ